MAKSLPSKLIIKNWQICLDNNMAGDDVPNSHQVKRQGNMFVQIVSLETLLVPKPKIPISLLAIAIVSMSAWVAPGRIVL